MNKQMLPNGGFPPISLCIKDKQEKEEISKEKGFFYSTKTNNLNIRKILNKSKLNKKVIDISRDEDTLEIVNSV
jgi:hypothetical protein